MSKINKYFNRDLSWLRFNHRVLQEMKDERNPLFERLKFAAIFASNLNEFFEVRISEIRRIKSLDKSLRKKLISKPNKLLKKIKKHINDLGQEFDRALFNDLFPALNGVGVYFHFPETFDVQIENFCTEYFKKNIADKIEVKHNFETDEDRLFIKNEKVYLTGIKGEKLLIYKLPLDSPRFIKIDTKKGEHFIFADDLIKLNLTKEHEIKFYSFKASRDAELYIEDEFSGDLKEKIRNSLSNRDTGQISTALIDKNMPEELKSLLFEKLNISDTDIILGGKYHKLKDLFAIPLPDLQEHQMPELKSIRSEQLACFNCIFKAIRTQDKLLYFPYESFEEIVRFVTEAATAKEVTVIKMTLYRVSKNSAIANELLKALANGKRVCVFIETKARFDESNNIYWGEKLKEAGATVIYSYPGIKVHTKIMYVEREEEQGKKAFAYIGTGNFNEKTSKIYTDLGLLTANKKITSEISQVFQLLERKIIVPKLKKILVSPFNTRSTFIKKIHTEIEHQQNGNESWIILKMNSLQDKEMIKALYEASQQGVKIKLLIRGICCLIPGIPGMSENIEVRSIVDRFLEHGRVYIFCNAGENQMYIGSADWMTRNLDHRIEVLTPIEDESIIIKIKHTIDLQLSDQVKSRIIDENQSNEYAYKLADYRQSSQHKIFQYLNELNADYVS